MRKNKITNRSGARQFRFLLDRPVPAKKSTIWDWVNLKSAITFGLLFSIVAYIITYRELKGQTCIYEYTSVPEDLKKKGFTEDLLTRTMNDIQYRINTYTDDIRSDLSKPKINYVRNHNPSYISSIQNMTIEGVPFKALIHFTDKMLSFFGMDVNDNYVSVEFYTTSKKLHASVLFKGGRREFTEYFDDIDPRFPLYNLCYNISITILEQSHPLGLAEYYYNLDEFEKCIKECMSVVASKKYSDIDKSRAYLFWGLSLNHNDYYTEDHSFGIQRKFKEAIKLDSNNYDAKLVSLRFDSKKIDEYEGNVRELLRHDSLSYQYWARLLSLDVDTTNGCSNYVETHELLYLKMKEKLKDSNYPSDIYWRYGRNLSACGDVNPIWYDSAISKFFQAVEIESNNPNTDLRKLSYYYNSIAYAFESKALTLAGNEINVCLNEFKNGKSDVAKEYLADCYAYARQAISADSLNAFAWSTLGEYYGFQYMIFGTESDLDNFIAAEKKAYQYSFPAYEHYSFEIDEYTTTEPYCFIKKTQPKKFNEIQKVERFYDRKNYLRRIRIL